MLPLIGQPAASAPVIDLQSTGPPTISHIAMAYLPTKKPLKSLIINIMDLMLPTPTSLMPFSSELENVSGALPTQATSPPSREKICSLRSIPSLKLNSKQATPIVLTTEPNRTPRHCMRLCPSPSMEICIPPSSTKPATCPL